MSFLATAWAALGEDPADLRSVRSSGKDVPLTATLPAGMLVHDAVAAASLSAGLLAARVTGHPTPGVSLDPVRVATAVTSERHFRLGGKPMDAWAELSGFWESADGWVRTHTNYPHHRLRLLGALGLSIAAGRDEVQTALWNLTSAEIEERVCGAGGVAAEVRSEDQWGEHPQAGAVASQPLIGIRRIGDGGAARFEGASFSSPAHGIRVLDLTRVIAGPVASRTLARWGADVLRVDPPAIAEVGWYHLDTGAGKRSTILAADDPRFDDLLDSADVVLTGYRPGALDRFGMSPEALSERRPGLVMARISAWGESGPFAGRRGFDSIVQAASGISWIESTDGLRPGTLPAQALDHSAGYFLAAAVTTALRRRSDEGGSWAIDVSLARVAQELLAAPGRGALQHPAFEPSMVTYGDVTVAAAAAGYEGGPDGWVEGPVVWGSTTPQWLSPQI